MKTGLDDFLTERQIDEFSAEYQEFLDNLPEMLEEPKTPCIIDFIASMKKIALETPFTRYFMDFYKVCGEYCFTLYPPKSATAWKAQEGLRVYEKAVALLNSIDATPYKNFMVVVENGRQHMETERGYKFTTSDGKRVCVAIVWDGDPMVGCMFN